MSFWSATCSKLQFAKIINRSTTFVDWLINMGVVKSCYFGKVLLFQSLRQFCDYLYCNGNAARNIELDAAISKICAKRFKIPRRSNSLNSARVFLPVIQAAEFNFHLMECLARLSDNLTQSTLDAAKSDLLLLKDKFEVAKSNLRRRILSKHIKPVQVETILLARYVDCDKFADIAEDYSYSLSHVYRLHRQGVSLFKSEMRK